MGYFSLVETMASSDAELVEDTSPQVQMEEAGRADSATDASYGHQEPIWKSVSDMFHTAAQDEELDIYQICAWVSCLPPDELSALKMSPGVCRLYHFKALVCFA